MCPSPLACDRALRAPTRARDLGLGVTLAAPRARRAARHSLETVSELPELLRGVLRGRGVQGRIRTVRSISGPPRSVRGRGPSRPGARGRGAGALGRAATSGRRLALTPGEGPALARDEPASCCRGARGSARPRPRPPPGRPRSAPSSPSLRWAEAGVPPSALLAGGRPLLTVCAGERAAARG